MFPFWAHPFVPRPFLSVGAPLPFERGPTRRHSSASTAVAESDRVPPGSCKLQAASRVRQTPVLTPQPCRKISGPRGVNPPLTFPVCDSNPGPTPVQGQPGAAPGLDMAMSGVVPVVDQRPPCSHRAGLDSHRARGAIVCLFKSLFCVLVTTVKRGIIRWNEDTLSPDAHRGDTRHEDTRREDTQCKDSQREDTRLAGARIHTARRTTFSFFDMAMNIKVVERAPDVKSYGDGSLGGKGTGLVRINECLLPQASKLKTWILTTSFYDRFLELGRKFGEEELKTVAFILAELGDIPVGVRSSATNEAGISPQGICPVRAGENASFMLPNNHPDSSTRLNQVVQAIYHIYDDFLQRQSPEGREKMAVVINPIHGVFDETLAGPFHYPYISGVANSFFSHALKAQNPNEGFARIAFGHGYATVLDDFPVISMVTIKNPIPIELLQIGNGQQFFYALDMTKNRELKGEELETMAKLHVRFANYHKIKLLGIHNNLITIEELVQNNHFAFKTGLVEIMEMIAAKISSHFQIEFIFNIDFKKKTEENGIFHVVQLTQLPELKFEAIDIPDHAKRTYMSINNAQGHGIKRGIMFAVVVSPFVYTKDMQEVVRGRISDINRRMRDEDQDYLIVVPGRLGSKNKDWGIYVDYKDVDKAVAIFEYGVDVAGRPEPLPEDASLTGGIYGSHFLYMIQGGFNEEQKRLQTRMYGTQGTHFLTNLMSNNVIYGFIAPTHDKIDPWLFATAGENDPLSVLKFPHGAAVYADSISQRCVVISENE